jgi:thiol-disulfide isomerase/thioredoxin/outer membrane murein-binding lipoprotein Lpp
MLRALLTLSFIGLIAGCASKGDIEDLSAKIDALSAKLDTLQAGGGAAQANGAQAETAARELYNAARTARRAGNDEEAKAKLTELTTKYGSTRTAQRASRDLAEINLIGSDAAAITAPNWYQGDAPDVSSGVSMVVFWEKWCPHCRREMPELEETFNKYKDRMSFVGLTKQSKNTSDDDVKSFISEHSITYPMAKEDGSMSQAYVVSGIPAAAVVKDGKVVWRGHPGSLTDAMLDGWLN